MSIRDEQDAGMADEAFERELFARRARALGDPKVPSLATVLRLAAAPEVSRARFGRERGWAQFVGSACLAAAVLLGVVRVGSNGPVASVVAPSGVSSDGGVAAVAASAPWSQGETNICAVDRSEAPPAESCACEEEPAQAASLEQPADVPAGSCESDSLCSLPH